MGGESGPAGLKARTGPTQKNLFKFFLNFQFGRALENCTGRF
jgi:hypothetical protein